jgi:hypothetical protein
MIEIGSDSPIGIREIRRFVMRKFPYGIYYRVQGDALRVLVIKHHKRHPDYGMDRLGL